MGLFFQNNACLAARNHRFVRRIVISLTVEGFSFLVSADVASVGTIVLLVSLGSCPNLRCLHIVECTMEPHIQPKVTMDLHGQRALNWL